ncbi:hypothetical protein T484DRAFT_1771408, partial [Baffinella frigidus]
GRGGNSSERAGAVAATRVSAPVTGVVSSSATGRGGNASERAGHGRGLVLGNVHFGLGGGLLRMTLRE